MTDTIIKYRYWSYNDIRRHAKHLIDNQLNKAVHDLDDYMVFHTCIWEVVHKKDLTIACFTTEEKALKHISDNK